MTLLNAIAAADAMRPNDIPNDVKASWLYELEADLAEMMEIDAPENPFPEDAQLLVSSPRDGFYALYLCAKIDHVLQDFDLYANDAAMADGAIAEFKAWYRRHNRHSSCTGNWRTL